MAAPSPITILIADDHELVRAGLRDVPEARNRDRRRGVTDVIGRCREPGARGYLVKGRDEVSLLATVHGASEGKQIWPNLPTHGGSTDTSPGDSRI